MALFKLKRVLNRSQGHDWIEVLAVEPYELVPHAHRQDILCQYVCRVPGGPGDPPMLVKLDSKDLWSEIGTIYEVQE